MERKLDGVERQRKVRIKELRDWEREKERERE